MSIDLIKLKYKIKEYINKLSKYNIFRVPKQVADIILCQGIKYGDVKSWNFLLERYQHTNIEETKNMFLNSLACSEDTILLNRLT